MLAISSCLKTPLEECTRQILGKCYSDANLLHRIKSVALTIFYAMMLLPTAPLWFIGDLVEWLSPKGSTHLNDAVVIPENAKIALSKETKEKGFSLSTYQNTSNRDFVKNSDWGHYIDELFPKGSEKEDLAPGHGVDILTFKGRKLICDRLIQMGGNALRFSVEWADVSPDGKEVNERALDKYVKVAEYLKSRGINPILTLHHFVTPINAKGKSIFEEKQSIDGFVHFAERVYHRFKHCTQTIFTFNEPHVNSAMNYILGEFPQKKKGHFWAHKQETDHMLEAHKRVHTRLHELAQKEGKKIEVGLTHQALRFIPSSRWNYLARIVSFVMTYLFHEQFLEFAKKNEKFIDRLGIQYYTRPLIGGCIPDSTHREGEKMIKSMKFRFHPQGILPIIEEISKALPNTPLMITETGMAGENTISPKTPKEHKTDQKRKSYYETIFKAVYIAQKTLKEKLNGFLFWSLWGNFEWAHGFSKKHDFGVNARDFISGKERITPAFQKIASVFKN